jgi:adenosylcobinamide-GDP ribazoletransferase
VAWNRRNTWDGLRLAVTLLSVIPVPSGGRAEGVSYGGGARGGAPGGEAPGGETSGGAPGRREAGAAMRWAPTVGLALGAVASIPLALGHWTGSLAAAALAVAVLGALTRGLHLDGLADLADGLGSGRPAEQALEIMRRSDIGPFGVVTLVLTLLIQVASLSHAASAPRAAIALITAAVTGRLAIVWACRHGVPPAREGGLGSMVAGTVPPVYAVLITFAALAVAAGLAAAGVTGWTLPPAVAAGLAGSWLLQRHAQRRLGGITGDVLGALCEVAATLTVLIACAL